MALPDPLGLFSDGGGGGGSAGGFDEFLAFLRDQRSELKELSEREQEQAREFASLRRGELLDRSGFAGLINVGEAQRRSDITLAAEIGRLSTEDPQRIAFEEALTTESGQRAQQTRVITGEQFRAEDALESLRERLEDAVTEEDVGAISGEFEEFQEEFEFFTDDSFLEDVQTRLGEVDEETRRRRIQRGTAERRRRASEERQRTGGN